MPGFFLGTVTWAPSFDGVVTGRCHANTSDSDPRGGEAQTQAREGSSSSGFACCSARERKGRQSQGLIDVSAGRDRAFGRSQPYIVGCFKF